MKYIDVVKLKNKVNEFRQDWLGNSTGLEVAEEGVELGAAESILDSIDDIIDSLQQEQTEVDLEKEMKEYFKGWTETEEGIACHYQYVDLNTCHGIASHFYELGLNARKEE